LIPTVFITSRIDGPLGQSHIASGVASILNATTPLHTVVIAHWLTADEK
jgi:hypothetical protein